MQSCCGYSKQECKDPSITGDREGGHSSGGGIMWQGVGGGRERGGLAGLLAKARSSWQD